MSGAEDWVKATGVPLPQCKMQGCCCRGASPSTPAHLLLEKAAQGDAFARDFFSIFVPYASQDEARSVVPGLVERTLIASQKDAAFRSTEDVVFYHCQFIGEDNRCQIWEDRPELCRAYPDTPFVVFAPNCAFEPWAKATREAFAKIKSDLADLKALQAQLESGEATPSSERMSALLTPQEQAHQLHLVLSLTPMYLTSPCQSFWWSTVS